MAAAPKTYLDLVKRLVSELGVDLPGRITSVLTTPATSYGGTTEFINKCVEWIAQAWIEIQEDQQDWDFMRMTGAFPLVQGQAMYDITLQTGLEEYDGIIPYVAPVQSRYIWLVNDTVSPPVKSHCYYIPPELYFGYFDRLDGAQGQSYRYTFKSNGCVLLDPPPGPLAGQLEFRYRRAVQEFTADTDTPTGLPPKFHMAIVYRAMEYYSGFDETQPQWGRAQKLGRRMMNKMYIELLPEYLVAGTR